MVEVVSKRKFEVECYKCFSTLSFTGDEPKEKRTSDYGGGSEIGKYITCPVCGNQHVQVDNALRNSRHPLQIG